MRAKWTIQYLTLNKCAGQNLPFTELKLFFALHEQSVNEYG